MIRANLPMAMQGLVVVPIFAGFDERAGVGRLFKYDVTGGRYEETDYFAQGSGGKDARDSLKKRFRRDMSRDEAVRAALEALLDAADEDLGTGGPDFQRGIFPTVKTISRSGITDLADDDVRRHLEADSLAASRGNATVMPLPYYVSPEQMMKDKAEYARKGISRGKAIVAIEYRDGILLVAENPPPCSTRSRRSTTASPSPAWASTTSSRTCGWRGCGTPTSRATPTRAAT